MISVSQNSNDLHVCDVYKTTDDETRIFTRLPCEEGRVTISINEKKSSVTISSYNGDVNFTTSYIDGTSSLLQRARCFSEADVDVGYIVYPDNDMEPRQRMDAILHCNDEEVRHEQVDLLIGEVVDEQDTNIDLFSRVLHKSDLSPRLALAISLDPQKPFEYRLTGLTYLTRATVDPNLINKTIENFASREDHDFLKQYWQMKNSFAENDSEFFLNLSKKSLKDLMHYTKSELGYPDSSIISAGIYFSSVILATEAFNPGVEDFVNLIYDELAPHAPLGPNPLDNYPIKDHRIMFRFARLAKQIGNPLMHDYILSVMSRIEHYPDSIRKKAVDSMVSEEFIF